MGSPGPETWSRDATMRYLNARPLPQDFQWPHRDGEPATPDRPVQPAHGAVTAYGKWLRETPYFPGLFELCHDVLAAAPEEFGAEWLPEELGRLREKFSSEPPRPGEHLAQMLRRRRQTSDQPTLF